jgi:hypothetical protein
MRVWPRAVRATADVGAELTERLGPRAQHVVFPGIAHITLGTDECTNQVAFDFVDDPHQALDTSCISP